MKEKVGVKAPQRLDDAEPDTLSYQRAVEEEADTRTVVVMSGCEPSVIIAELHGVV